MNQADQHALDLLDQIGSEKLVWAPLALVVAHPDDESIAAAGSLNRFKALSLIHLTDGAPESTQTLAGMGYATRAAYAAVRHAELCAALKVTQAAPLRQLSYGLADQSLQDNVDTLATRLAYDLLSTEAVITHPYEGGHNDHDAVAHAVQKACKLLFDTTGRAPARLEFASYFRWGNDVRTGEFWPDPACPERRVALSPAAIRQKEAAFNCFPSQRDNLRYFSAHHEAFRIAPVYDFAAPPPPLA